MFKSVFAVFLASLALTNARAQNAAPAHTEPLTNVATASDPIATFPTPGHTPKLSEQQATRLQLAAAQLQVIQYKYLQAKAEFEKIQTDSTAEFQKQSAELTAQIEAAYKTVNVDKKDWKLDPVTATWSPVEKEKAK